MSINKILKSALLSLIPGMVLGRIDKLLNDMDSSNPQKRMRASIRIVSLSLCFLFGSILGGFIAPILFTPVVGAAGPILGSISVGFVFAEWGAILSKQALRLFSWVQHFNDTTVLNPTYPAKYTVNYGMDEIPSAKAQDAMKKLYKAKQQIKQNPRGYFGDLSFKQRDSCRAINYAAEQLRNTGSIYRIFRPSSYRIKREDPTLREKFYPLVGSAVDSEISINIRAIDIIFFFGNRINEEHLHFLSHIILEPDTDDARICSEGFSTLLMCSTLACTDNIRKSIYGTASCQ